VGSQRPRSAQGRAHDVAIYSPFASLFYGRPATQTGGAELQTVLLARELEKRRLRVAHVIYPVGGPRRSDDVAPTLVERAPWRGGGRLGPIAEAREIWRGFAAADAAVYVIRGSGGHVIPAAAFCRARRRRFVFSSSSELDFQLDRPDRAGGVLRAYGRAVRQADRLVVQTERQRELASRVFPQLDPVVIPSFAQAAEPAASAPGYFIWVNRMVGYKLPERYVELARALPEADFRMVAGTTSETSDELASRVAAAAGDVPNLKLEEARPREELLAELDGAVAMVTTSEIEGMPNTFLEAWARGVPVLSLHVDPGGVIGREGLGIVAGGSMERLIEAARELWRDPERRAEIGGRAREYVRQRHSPDVVADSWAALIRELL
jgi:glycosyltransferase involved in cell wall biosynthesis